MTQKLKSLRILAGSAARAHIAERGLNPADIRAIPAAAGGPKGLLLNRLDQYLFGDWLKQSAQPVHLVGASVGAWRMACAAANDPVKAFSELARLYVGEQRYEGEFDGATIASACDHILRELTGPIADEVIAQTRYQLHLLAVRGVGSLAHPNKGHASGYVRATLANMASRQRLNKRLERVVFSHGALPHFFTNTHLLTPSFDGINTRFGRVTAGNLRSVLAASGAIPLVIDPVQSVEGAFDSDIAGPFWDGGITDYHIHWPWPCLGGITLYPHFAPHIIPGWLDKFLPHRRAKGAWLDNTVLLCPTDEFVKTLPRHKIPDRSDFKFYIKDHPAREREWHTSIAQAQALADDFAAFAREPQRYVVDALN